METAIAVMPLTTGCYVVRVGRVVRAQTMREDHAVRATATAGVVDVQPRTIVGQIGGPIGAILGAHFDVLGHCSGRGHQSKTNSVFIQQVMTSVPCRQANKVNEHCLLCPERKQTLIFH